MKKVLTLMLVGGILTGCSGFVNQESIAYVDPKKMNTESELYTYVVKIDKLLRVYDKEKTQTTKLDLDAEELKVKLGLSHEQTEKLVKLAEDLDQINSQNYPILFTMFLGLNSNPSSSTNRAKFWSSLDNLINKTYEARNNQIKAKRDILIQPQPAKKPPKIVIKP